MKKRVHTPTAKPGELKIAWGRPAPQEAPDVCVAWGDGVPRPDSSLLMHAISGERYRPSLQRLGGYETSRSLLDELELRGYDLTTLKISIQKKKKLDE